MIQNDGMNIIQKLERAREEGEHLRRIATNLVRMETSQQVRDFVVEECLQALSADAVCLHLIQPDGRYEMVAERNCTPEFKTEWRYIPKEWLPLLKLDDPHETMYVATADEFKKDIPNSDRLVENSRRKLIAYAPLVVNSVAIGILGFSYNTPRDSLGKEFIATLVNIFSQGIERVRLLENDRRARREAEQANQAKSSFLANVSHEIRTPLTAIQGFADLLCGSESLGIEEKAWAGRILKNTQHLTGLIGDILDISKIEAKSVEVNLCSFRIEDLIEDAKAATIFRAQQKGLKLKFVTGTPDVEIFSDPIHLRQILINLIGNAIKFTNQGEVCVSFKFEESRMQIWVKDTGVGVPLSDQGRIFEPFTQGDNVDGRVGTGLGLAISKRLTEALAGKLVLLESEPGKGTTFVVEISCHINFKGKAKVITHNDVAPKKLNGYRVLLVDDSSDNRYLLRHVLSKEGAHVDVAEDGTSGVSKAMAAEYDIVVMDIQMPNLDGNAAARELRARHYSKPLVALTASALTSERDLSYKSGFNEYLTKPIDFEQLISTIKRLA